MSEPGTIYYTTDGTNPTTLGNIYNGPITISSSTILKYLAIDLAGNPSPIYTQTYTIDTIPPTANANPTGGLYNTNKNVVLTMSEPGTIYYTLDGSTYNIYSGPITITSTTILKFFAIDLAGNPSPTYTQTYTIDTIAPTASANPTGGLYNTNKTVTLNMSKPGTIYYTTNGTTPTTSSDVYTGPITISSNTILKFFAIDLAGNPSPTYTETYTIDINTPTANANPTGGLYNTTKTVTLTMSEPGTIYYTTNGTNPTTSSNIYNGPISIKNTTTLKYLAEDLAGNTSPIYTEIYTIDITSPTASANPVGGIYNTTKTVLLTMNEAGTIYYTTNGTNPTTSSNIYNGPISIKNTTTLKYLAVDLAGNKSLVYSATYTIDKIPPKASPNIKSGLYNTNKIVKLSMNKKGTIYYTLNGKTPTKTSKKYMGPITIKSTSTLKYLAVDLAGNKSPIYTYKYTIDKTAPKVVSTTPKSNTRGTSLTASLTIKFSEKINKGLKYSKIYIKNITTGKTAKSTVTSISGNTITIRMILSRLSLDSYWVYIPKNAVKDNAKNNNNKYVLKFKTSKY